MIGYLRGKVIDERDGRCIVDVNGVGYSVMVPVLGLIDRDEVELFVYTHVREDEISLYGFVDKLDLLVFKLLLSVKGVGPKVSMSLVSYVGSSRLARSVIDGDVKTIQDTPGIGKKGAERIILELREKFEEIGVGGGDSNKTFTGNQGKLVAEGVDALVSLGYNKKESEEIVGEIMEETKGKDLTIEDLIKRSLRYNS